jgi:hypothetical protein
LVVEGYETILSKNDYIQRRKSPLNVEIVTNQ